MTVERRDRETDGRVTIAQVARAAGVSVPTVSKVLNDRVDVSADTRTRVQRALTSQGYRRRGQIGGRHANLVDLVVGDLDSPYALEVLDGAERAAAAEGVGLVITATRERPSGQGQWLPRLIARRSAGLVLTVSPVAPSTAAQLAELHTPLVLLDGMGGSDPSLPTVGATNWAGGVAATEHLIGLGHRRVAIITGLLDLLCSQERVDGYRSAMGRAGLGIDERLMRDADFKPDGARREAARLLDLDDPPTAIFAGSDMQASGVYEEARTRGLRIPEDLSVVGFDDLSICRFLSPRLTTVRQPLAEMAAQAVRLALDLGRNGLSEAPPRLQLATSLVVRDSTAPPPRG